ncbi:cadherin-87A [Caerostris extrusa]|uniref:Cadherin-87A n=1 Tax=Caerostris extrusa TaxID=172846 RepID=A0AAV4QKR0_CAEEX|nr:cadherin-87A [Caerostris extrusa]
MTPPSSHVLGRQKTLKFTSMPWKTAQREASWPTLVATDPDSNIAEYRIEPENEVISVKSRVDYESIQESGFQNLLSCNSATENSPQGTSVAGRNAIDSDAETWCHQVFHCLVKEVFDFHHRSKKMFISNLEDRNDNPPMFSQREYEASIVSNLPISPPSSVLQLTAEDRDIGENAKIPYSIISGNEKGRQPMYSLEEKFCPEFQIEVVLPKIKTFSQGVEKMH